MNVADLAPRWTYDPHRTGALRPVDGDSVWVRLGLAVGVSLDVELRVRNINAPERGKPGWQEAKDALWQMVAGKDLYIVTFKEGRSFIRYVADIYVDPDAAGELVSVGEAMIAAGHAVRWEAS